MRSEISTILTATALALGCAPEPAIDTTSEETYEESLATVRASLPDSLRPRFDSAAVVVAMGDVDLGNLFGQAMAGTFSEDQILEDAMARFDGLTGRDVIRIGDSIQAARRAERRRQAEAEIRELEAKRDSAESARDRLSAFIVERSRLLIEEGFLGEEIVVELTVSNGLDQAVSRAYFHGTYQSPGRSVPWLQEDFNYSIPGGLEPGETAQWRLKPNRYSEWGQATEAPADAVLTVEPYRLDGADSEPLFGGVRWTEADEERLEALQSSLETRR